MHCSRFYIRARCKISNILRPRTISPAPPSLTQPTLQTIHHTLGASRSDVIPSGLRAEYHFPASSIMVSVPRCLTRHPPDSSGLASRLILHTHAPRPYLANHHILITANRTSYAMLLPGASPPFSRVSSHLSGCHCPHQCTIVIQTDDISFSAPPISCPTEALAVLVSPLLSSLWRMPLADVSGSIPPTPYPGEVLLSFTARHGQW